VKHNDHTHSTSHWIRKNQMFHFPKLEHPIWAVMTIFWISYVSVFKTGCFGFYWLIPKGYFFGTSITSFPLPPLEGAGSIHETHLFLSLCEFSSRPLCDFCVIYEKFKFGFRESSLWAFEHLSFVKQFLWHLLLLEMKPPKRLGIALEFPRLWWSVEKFVNVYFASVRKEARV
jgi:hypothetical protein